MATAKIMNRSRNQLATSYAPESFFTFEGGAGACISHGTPGEALPARSATVTDQILDRIQELGQSWYESAMRAHDGDNRRPPVIAKQCVDHRLLNEDQTDFVGPTLDKLYLCRPSHMEYTPAPLSFVCRTCSLFQDFDSLKKAQEYFERHGKQKCQGRHDGGRCDWEQLDIIFVHWSGSWTRPFPGQFQWDAAKNAAEMRRSSCMCGSSDFRLNRSQPGIGDWFFECAKCRKPLSGKWLQNDKESLEFLGPQWTDSRLTEVRMQAAPYRASAVYYVKQDLFIHFREGANDYLSRLQPGQESALKDFIAKEYGFGVGDITDQDVYAACAGKPECASDIENFRQATAGIATIKTQMEAMPQMRSMLETLLVPMRGSKQQVIDKLREKRILIPAVNLPSALTSNLHARRDLFAAKFDPFRLAIEHASLRETRLHVETLKGGKRPYVSFRRLDPDLSPKKDEDKHELEQEAAQLLDDLGFEDMGLVREFDLCRFTFGYSRMDSNPILRDKRSQDMPVRLRLFPQVRVDGGFKNPVYVVEQANEALYVRLNPTRVMDWLKTLDCPDMFTLSGEETVGAGVLQTATRMSVFLDGLQFHDKPPVYYYLYTLLHSFSHLLMKHVAEYSGLDLGSLGEYIFPADLAFVVYRNGTTMDLGNLSAMWRNAGIAMLREMLGPRATMCGTGSLCSHRGGSCPDCIMVPETSCIAGNKFLSRSVLGATGGRPRFDTRDGSIRGYLARGI